MILKCPSAPFEPLHIRGESITLDVDYNVLVLPTGDATLPTCNESTLAQGHTLAAGTHIFTDDLDSDTGLHNLLYPWIAGYDDSSDEVDFFLFTTRLNNLKCVVDASGRITQLVLYPGNGLIYHGRVTYSDLSRDTNSDLIPDFLDGSLPGSVTAFLQSYRFPTFLLATSDGYVLTTSDGYTLEVS